MLHGPLIQVSNVSPAVLSETADEQLPELLRLLSGASPFATLLLTVYLAARLVVPVLLIRYLTRGATPKQRVGLAHHYLKITNDRGRHRSDGTARFDRQEGVRSIGRRSDQSNASTMA